VNYNREGRAHAGNDARSVSEGHGYGMLAAVLMAENIPASTAHEDFDGLYRFFRAHPSHLSPDLMAWLQAGPKLKDAEGGDSATDGDLDIAYALLLADAQWGSAGEIDYRGEAARVIAAIKAHEVNRATWTIKLGDFAQDARWATAMRTSDFMPQHWHSFGEKTADTDWEKLRAKTYTVCEQVFTAHALQTGLFPDFLQLASGRYRPPAGKLLEGRHDGAWYYNACRTPWRLATDRLVTGESRGLPQLQAPNRWMHEKTQGQPAAINAGYTLAGVPIGDDRGACFLGPLAVSAMVGGTDQRWLDELWAALLARDATADDDYFSNSVKLLCLIVLSGNWWAP
jgi:hypothetical protein